MENIKKKCETKFSSKISKFKFRKKRKKERWKKRKKKGKKKEEPICYHTPLHESNNSTYLLPLF